LYYKLIEEDLEEITKDWSIDLLIPTNHVEMSDHELDSSKATHKEHDTPRTSTRKKIEEFQDLSSASEKTASVSPGQGGDEEVEEVNGKEDDQNQGEVTLPRDEVYPLNKRKVSPSKPASQKISRATLTNMQIVLTVDDFDFIIAAINDTSQEIL
jgi:hypothetical protein